MTHQLPEAEKAARADVVYENSGTLEESTPSWPASSSGSCDGEAGGRRAGRAAVVSGVAYAWVDHTQPAWWVRLRYPLYYRDSIVGYGHKYHLDPALIAAVVYEESAIQGELGVERRRHRPHAASAVNGQGHRDAHRRDEVRPAPRPLRRRPEPTLRELVPGPPAAEVRRSPQRRRPRAGGHTTPARRTSTTGSARRPRASASSCASPRRATMSMTFTTSRRSTARRYGDDLEQG